MTTPVLKVILVVSILVIVLCMITAGSLLVERSNAPAGEIEEVMGLRYRVERETEIAVPPDEAGDRVEARTKQGWELETWREERGSVGIFTSPTDLDFVRY